MYELLQGRTFRSISWSTLFGCLSIYEEKFKQSLQSAGPVLPEIQEGDAKALVAYLCVLRKVFSCFMAYISNSWPDFYLFIVILIFYLIHINLTN